MASTRAAVRYAKAILDVAQSKSAAQQVGADMLLIESTINSNAELSTFIANPTISSTTKESALLEIFSSQNESTNKLFHLLAINKRFELLQAIAVEYTKLLEEINNVEVATVTTAFPLTDDLETKVLSKIKEFTSKTVTINNIIDESIIGGFILRIGDKQYNASVANRLQVLKRELNN